MQTVSRFEANLLRLLYYFLRREPFERVAPLLEARCEPPACLNRGAVRLVQEALAKGCTFLLAQRGGWRNERFLRGERAVSGRLWERTPPENLGLSFSDRTLEFLVWITAARPGDKDPRWAPDERELTLGDLLLLFFAHEGLRESADSLGAPDLRKKQPFMNHALCWLAYPEDYGQTPGEAQPNFDPWTNGLGSCMLEALQPDLAARWVHVESTKERLASPQTMRALGRSQERVLCAFLDNAERVGRLDLTRFLLRTLSIILGPYAHHGMWTGALQTAGMRLVDRAELYQYAVVVPRQMDRLHDWAQTARRVSYFDEGYQAAQLYLADWEYYQGNILLERAQAIIRQLDPMRQA
jgi:FtsH ternary system domain X6